MVRTWPFHCSGARFSPWSGTQDPASLHQPKKPKGINFWRKVLKNLQSSKPVFLCIYFIGFFYVSVVYFKCKWMSYLHSFMHYIKNYPRKIFLLKRKFVLLLLPCRKVITEKQQQSSETALLVYQAHVRPRRRLCEGRRLLRLWGLFYGSFGIICAVIASTTYISSGVFTHLSVFLKGLFKQLHPTLVFPFSLQFLWSVSSLPKNWEIYYWFINSVARKWVHVCVCVCVCVHASMFWIHIIMIWVLGRRPFLTVLVSPHSTNYSLNIK